MLNYTDLESLALQVTIFVQIMRRLLRYVGRALLALVAVLVLLWVLIQLPPVQTALVRYITGNLTEGSDFTIEVGHVDVRFPLELVLRDVTVIEGAADTLLTSRELSLQGVELALSENRFAAHRVELVQPVFKLHVAEGASDSNLDRFMDLFETGDTAAAPADVRINVEHFRLRNGRFNYHNDRHEVTREVIDFNHLDLSDINIELKAFELHNERIDVQIKNIALYEPGGLHVQHLGGDFAMRNDTLQLQNYELQTKRSLLCGNLIFRFERWANFSHFNSEVAMRGNLVSSTIDFKDLARFSSTLKGLDRSINFDGRFTGTVADLKVRDFVVGLDDETKIAGRIDLTGLPDFNSTFIDLSITELTTVKTEIDRIPLPPFETGKMIETPNNITELGKISFQGKFTGFPNDFVAFGTLKTDIGSISTDIKLQETGDTYEYSGSLATQRFDLAKFYNSRDLGPLTSALEVSGRGLTRDDLDMTVDGQISFIRLRGYSYNDIVMRGQFKQDFFNGNMQLNDENAQLDFVGLIDFTQQKPLFNFTTSITHLDPVALNLLPLKEYTSLSGDFTIEAEGSNLNDINGSIVGDSLKFCTAVAEYPIKHLEIIMEQNLQMGKRFTLISDIATGRLNGKFDFAGLENGIRNIISDVVPHIETPPEGKRGREDFYLEVDIHNFELVSEVFIPELSIAKNSRFSLLMDDLTGDFKTTFTTDRVSYLDYALDSLIINMSHPDESMNATLVSSKADLGGFILPSLGIDIYNDADTIYTNLNWGVASDMIAGDFGLRTLVRGEKNFTSTVNTLNIRFNQDQWSSLKPSTITIDSTRIAIDELELSNMNASIRLAGAVSEASDETLLLDLKGIDLQIFNALLSTYDIAQMGIVTGNVQLRDVYNSLLLTCDLIVTGYGINEYPVGDLCVESSWDPLLKRLLLAGEIERNQLKSLLFGGYYFPNRTENSLELSANLNDLPLMLVNAFVSEGISDLQGTIDGRIDIGGTPATPLVSGEVRLNKASVHVDYLNTTYYIDNKARISENKFSFNFPIRDQDDNTGYIVGTILHENFTNWNFDIFLDLENSPFLCLNTTEEDNSLYYGKAYVTGFVNISGGVEDIMIDVTARSEKGTAIALPLGGSEDVTFAEFITFVNTSEPEEDEKSIDLSGIQMNFELDITPDAQFRIIFDELVGDEIRGRGAGNIRMVINNLNSFYMYGGLTVDQGRYLFTLKNLINKEFDVKPGGTINWYGDPLAADIDLGAIYRVNTSLYDLFPDESDQYKQRVPVNLQMNLTGKLMNPGIDFDIQLPSSDELTRARVKSAINTQQEVNRQAFSLLVLRRFISPPDIAKTNANIGLAENSTELITSQLSNWLSQISDDFDIGVNYSPGDEISNEELAVALSTQLFNDRLLVSGNFGVQQGQNSAVANENTNNLIGDIRIEYKIHPQGKIRIIVYNQSNEFDLARSRQNSYTQGMGVVYQEEFNSIYELFGITRPSEID